MHMDLEKHGREVYTHDNFYIFQKELWSACVDCGIEGAKEDEACSKVESDRTLVSKAWTQLFKCMHMAGTNKEKLTLIYNEGFSIEQEISNMKSDVASRPLDDMETFIGCNVPKKIEVLPPEPSHTKGCGKRMKAGKEKAMEQQQKVPRFCHACKQYATHDSRNCPTKKSS
ncbi:hypothetical protein TSUD_392090 [Trifolium subterraneum]|uniref:Protein FAR1-RELATED SEQUENCE n=1 Tax=Trifolium subterraneum TaxID=3900 RepID=A0A2Z6NCA4_TRISU|nr:hypothetical protein TSUD_392090 [Trifolium subterraneum]